MSDQNKYISDAVSNNILVRTDEKKRYEHPVETPHPEYLKMMSLLSLPRALVGGTATMRKAGEKFLPQNERESDEDYEGRLKRNVLVNSFSKGIHNISSRPFSKDMTMENIPTDAEPWFDNIDKLGNNMHVFTKGVLEDAMTAGLTHILAEYPAVNQPNLTLQDARVLDIRPYLVHIKAENLIGWKYEMINGVNVLTQVRIVEYVNKEVDRFNIKKVKQIRVLEAGRYELWQRVKDKWTMIEEGVTSLNYIPLTTYYTNKTGFMTATPPLMDLAYLNNAHWQSMSDYRTMLHVSSFPLLFARMLTDGVGIDGDEEVVVGPHNMIEGHTANADLKYVEHQGNSIAALKSALDDLKNDMDILALSVMIKKQGTTTATESRINHSSSLSQLGDDVVALESAMEKAITEMFDYIGGNNTIKVNIFKDFEISLDSLDNDTLVRMGSLGLITERTMLTELKRRGLFSPELDIETEVTLLQDAQGILNGNLATNINKP